MLAARDWLNLSRLLETALSLPESARSSWLAGLPADQEPLKNVLQELLSREDLRSETGGFLSTLPKLTAAGAHGFSGLSPGALIGPYRLERELGAGGMASVWLAERTDGLLRRKVALKLPHLSSALEGLAERMARERDILAALEHPNIARLYDAGVAADGRPYLALEYVEGEPIDRYCERCGLDIVARLGFVLQVARAVTYAHTRLIVHRDLKPSNIQVDPQGGVHLLDFGIAKLLDPNVVETRITQFAGRALTPRYASPEQIRGEPVSTASDVYSLGVLLYELLTGESPYGLGATAGALILAQAVLTSDPVRPSETAASPASKRKLRGDLDTIVLKALKKDPAERYATVAELADDLERYLHGQPVRARPDSLWYRSKKFVGRNKLAVGAGLAVVLALSVGLTLAIIQAQRARQETARVEAAQSRLLTQTAADRLRDGDVGGAQAIILEVLAKRDPVPAEALSVFQEARAAPSELAILSGHSDWVRNATFSRDGTRIVTASEDKTARVWDAHTGMLLTVLIGHVGRLSSAAFSPDGSRIVTGSADGTARIWDARTGDTLKVLSGHADSVRSACYSPDGARIVTGSDDKTARVWDAYSGAQLAVLTGHQDGVRSVAYSPDGAQIGTASADRTARIYDAHTGRQLVVLADHADAVEWIAYSPDAARVVTASDDNTVRIWNAHTGTLIAVLKGHGVRVYSAAYGPQGQRLVTAADDNTAQIWDAPTGTPLAILGGQVLADHGDSVFSATYSPDGSRIVTASDDGTARVWDARVDRALKVLAGHADFVQSAKYSPDGTHIVTASIDKTARIWDSRTGRSEGVLAGHTDVVQSAAYSPDGSRIVTASWDRTARVWDAHTGALLRVLSGHGALLYSASYSPDGDRIVTASGDKTARVWDAKSGTQLMVLAGHTKTVDYAVYSPDGTRIATASTDKTARIWDARTGSQLAVVSGHTDVVQWVAYSPDGKRIVTASDDRTARTWDARTGAAIATLAGHRGRVYTVAYSPDGRHIVTASVDKTARIWDAQTGLQLAVLAGHGSVVDTAEYAPDGHYVVTASDDKTARIWDAQVPADLDTQIRWTRAAQFDPLTEAQRTQLGLAPAINEAGLGDASRCDGAAGAPYDPERRAPGLELPGIAADTAVLACSLELSHSGGTSRLRYELGRALSARHDRHGARTELERAVASGYRAARIDLADQLLEDAADARDRGRAIALYEQAWDSGVTIAAFRLGTLYELGGPGTASRTVAPDVAKAWHWYQRGADAAEPHALARFAEREEQDAATEQGDAQQRARLLRAFRYYAAAAERARLDSLPDDTWRSWRYRRASLARLLAAEGMMQEVADGYSAAALPVTPRRTAWWKRLSLKRP
jgi:WD40 repeat protein/serine/threonine protein kinase/TPR repeat protein